MAAVMADPQIDELDCLPQRIKTAAMQQKCVLLIEDSEEAMLLVRFAVEEYGRGAFRLEWAHNLSSGLDHLAQGGVDVVLLDLGLPESSGAESYAWVREIAPELPIVVLTGDSQMETESAVIASGAEGYLVKNQVSASQMMDAVWAALDSKKRRISGGHSGPQDRFSASLRI